MSFRTACSNGYFAAFCASLVSVISFASPSDAAPAPAQECTAVDNVDIRAATPLTIDVKLGDFIVIGAPTDPHDSSGSVSISFFGASGTSVPTPASFAAAQDGTIVISQEAGGGAISCRRDNSETANPARVLFYVNSHAQSIQAAVLMNLRSRRDGGGNVATQNQLFISTKNLGAGGSYSDNPEYNAWVALQGRKFEGDSDGSNVALTFGVDRWVGQDSLVGGYLSYSKLDLDTETLDYSARSAALGLYLSVGLAQNLVFDADLGYSQPRYEVDGQDFTSERVFGSLALRGEYELGKALMQPYVSLRSTVEKQPSFEDSNGNRTSSNVIRSHVGTLGLRMDAVNANAMGIKPYVSIAADFGKTTSDEVPDDEFRTPRIGFGFNADLGNGQLGLDLDAGHVSSDTRDIGGNINYQLRF